MGGWKSRARRQRGLCTPGKTVLDREWWQWRMKGVDRFETDFEMELTEFADGLGLEVRGKELTSLGCVNEVRVSSQTVSLIEILLI